MKKLPMPTGKDIGHALLIGLWFMFLTFPLLVIKVNPGEQTVSWRWANMLWVGGASAAMALAGRLIVAHRAARAEHPSPKPGWFAVQSTLSQHFTPDRLWLLGGIIILIFLALPLMFSTYQVNIMTTALMYVILGLGLNIVVGFAGLLNLGHVAFYAVGAYTYGLLHLHFNLGFWIALPIGGLMGGLFGILLGFPVLRLRGDYLAIVTLGFGEIIRLVLVNWGDLTQGPSGIADIPRPGLFGLDLSLNQYLIYQYYLTVIMMFFTIFVVNRLRYSRLGRAWFALREDEIACQAMGINKTAIKLTAFSLGAAWAAMAGVLFAAKTTFINPDSFTFMESAFILCIVVLGGMGSITGVVLAALILMLLPEYLRAVAEYRMLVFGAVLVVLMIVRPSGLIPAIRRTYSAMR
ncbi:MAG: branched-chain amino acid ABC transporter permease [Proteobacteria bacterium]|nr:branched-chain amino acid ABC transporter permease [Pseudomonadota bacterium]